MFEMKYIMATKTIHFILHSTSAVVVLICSPPVVMVASCIIGVGGRRLILKIVATGKLLVTITFGAEK